jgi:hypothetical protein
LSGWPEPRTISRLPVKQNLSSPSRPDYSTYRQHSQLTDLGADGGRLLDPSAYYQETVYPLFTRYVRHVSVDLRNLNEETMYTASVKAGNVARRAIWSTYARCGVGIDCGPDFQPVSRGADLPTDPAFHGGIPENLIGRLCRSGAVWEPVMNWAVWPGSSIRWLQQLGHYHEMNIEQIIVSKKTRARRSLRASRMVW